MADNHSDEPRVPEIGRYQARCKDAAATLVEFLRPDAWIPPAHVRWIPVIEALLEAFLRHFDQAMLNRLVDDQRALPPSVSAAARAARMAGELTALHKICQMLARNPRIPTDARAALALLESLPPEAIPDTAVSTAVTLAARAEPDLELDPENPRIARGSVADVFRFRDREDKAIAFKTVRADSVLRVQNEAAILLRMAGDCGAVGGLVGPEFAAPLAEALRDAAGALLREIDFVREALNLRDAGAFYKFNRRVRIPAAVGVPLDRGIFMEFVEGIPLLDAPLDRESRRDVARLVFRRLVLDPLFSGLSQSIFHGDPHAGNLMVQMQKHAPPALVILDWSQAGRLSAALRHTLVELCLYCVTGDTPPPDVLTRLLESNGRCAGIALPQGAGDPLRAAFDIVQQLAVQGHPVPANLLLLRKSLLTLDGITRQLDPGFDAWRETLAYASEVLASEAAVRSWSIPFAWLDRPDFYRSGLPTRTLLAHLAGTILRNCAIAKKSLARMQNPCDVT